MSHAMMNHFSKTQPEKQTHIYEHRHTGLVNILFTKCVKRELHMCALFTQIKFNVRIIMLRSMQKVQKKEKTKNSTYTGKKKKHEGTIKYINDFY